MLCQKCKQRPASIHITKIVNGEKRELHVCDQCGSLNDVFDQSFNFQNFITNMLDFDIKNYEHSNDIQYRCDKCGMDFNTFKEHGKFGCEKCYETFKPMVNSMIKKMHGSDRHKGKVIKLAGEDLKFKNRLDELNTSLKQAINKEEYEKAAVYRDEIKKIKDQYNKEDDS